MDDLNAIIAQLTKASLRALPRIGTNWTDEGYGFSRSDAYSLGWGRNAKLRLVEKRIEPGRGKACCVPWQWRLTPLGLQVRARLSQPMEAEHG